MHDQWCVEALTDVIMPLLLLTQIKYMSANLLVLLVNVEI